MVHVGRCVLGGPPMRPATDTCHGSIAGEGSFAGPGSLDPKTLPPPDDTRKYAPTPPRQLSALPEATSSAVWGYYLRDEPTSSQWPLMKQQQDRIRAAQPDALVFINLGPPGGENALAIPTEDKSRQGSRSADLGGAGGQAGVRGRRTHPRRVTTATSARCSLIYSHSTPTRPSVTLVTRPRLCPLPSALCQPCLCA